MPEIEHCCVAHVPAKALMGEAERSTALPVTVLRSNRRRARRSFTRTSLDAAWLLSSTESVSEKGVGVLEFILSDLAYRLNGNFYDIKENNERL